MDYGHEVVPTADGGYLLVGSESGFYYPTSLDHARSHADIILIRTDSVGNELWRQTYGGAKHELGRAMHEAADGGWYLFGSTQSEGAGSFDQFLLKVDANGDSLWSRTYGGAEWDYGNSIDMDAQGNLYLLGTTNSAGYTNSPDIWLRKTDPEGNSIWALTIGGSESDYGYQVRALPEGGCLVVGATRSYGRGGQDIFFLRVTAQGRIDLFLDGDVKNDALVYPVPVKGESVVDASPLVGQVAYTWRLLDVSGRLLMEEEVDPGSRGMISAADLPEGVYIYEILVNDERRATGRILVD